MQLKDDPVIAEIRTTRHKISEEFGHNPQSVIAHYMKLQKQQEILSQRQKQTAEARPLNA